MLDPSRQFNGVFILHHAFMHQHIGRLVATTLSIAGFDVYIDDKLHSPERLPTTHSRREFEMTRRQIGVCLVSSQAQSLDKVGPMQWFQADYAALASHASHLIIIELDDAVQPCMHTPPTAHVFRATTLNMLNDVLQRIPKLITPPPTPPKPMRPILPASASQVASDFAFMAAYDYYKAFQIDEMKTALDDVLAINPQHFGALVLLTRYLVSFQQLAEALETTYRLETIDRHDLWVYSPRASILLEMGRKSEALTLINKCIERNPTVASLYGVRARLHLHAKNYDDALADINQGIELSPMGILLRLSGMVKLLLQDYQGAIRDFQTANNRMFSVTNLAGVAIALYYLGRVQDARQYWTDLLAIDTSYAQLDYLTDAIKWPPPLRDVAEPALRMFNSLAWIPSQ